MDQKKKSLCLAACEVTDKKTWMLVLLLKMVIVQCVRFLPLKLGISVSVLVRKRTQWGPHGNDLLALWISNCHLQTFDKWTCYNFSYEPLAMMMMTFCHICEKTTPPFMTKICHQIVAHKTISRNWSYILSMIKDVQIAKSKVLHFIRATIHNI